MIDIIMGLIEKLQRNHLGGITHEISQYADDSILFMPFNINSIDSTFGQFEQCISQGKH